MHSMDMGVRMAFIRMVCFLCCVWGVWVFVGLSVGGFRMHGIIHGVGV